MKLLKVTSFFDVMALIKANLALKCSKHIINAFAWILSYSDVGKEQFKIYFNIPFLHDFGLKNNHILFEITVRNLLIEYLLYRKQGYMFQNWVEGLSMEIFMRGKESYRPKIH